MMGTMTKEIAALRERFRDYILVNDLTLRAAADLVGWKRAASVYKFLAGKHKPNDRRLYRIRQLLQGGSRGRKSAHV